MHTDDSFKSFFIYFFEQILVALIYFIKTKKKKDYWVEYAVGL